MRKRSKMEKILPLVIICSVGIVVCLTLLVVIAVKAIKSKFMRAEYEEIEIDDNVLTVSLKKKRKKHKKDN